jgi:signal recognition particle receptor subunit beta
VISSGGVLCYSKNFFDDLVIKKEVVGGFLSGISYFGQEIKAGQVKTLNFKNLNFHYSYSKEFDYIFVIVTDKDQLENTVKPKVEIMKSEFIKRYSSLLKDWSGNTSIFKSFDNFVENEIVIPPKILLLGSKGVGKNTIMNLLHGENLLEIDENLNEITQKIIDLPFLIDIKQCVIMKIDMEELAYNTIRYNSLLISVDIIIIITNSAYSNLKQTKSLYSRIKPKTQKANIYLIANYQDEVDTAIEPEKIEELFNLKTYGFSAIKEGSDKKILFIINDILKNLVEKKYNLV